MKKMYRREKQRSGQAMIIAILTLGGAILGATTLAGFLLLYQIRATTNSEDSAKAIFAADSGVNWALYSYFNSPNPQPQPPELADGATVQVICYDALGNPLTVCDNTGVGTSSYAIAEGVSNGSRRAFSVSLVGGTSTVP